MAQQDPYKTKYDIIKQRMMDQAGQGETENKEAVAREFARRGLANSGAAIKMQQQAADQFAQRKDQAAQTAELAKAEDESRRLETEQARAYQTSERLGSQAYGSKEAALQRLFGATEAEKQRGFMASESALGRQFQSAEAASQRNFSKELFDKEMVYKEAALGLQTKQVRDQWDMAAAQLQLDKEVSKFNMEMAQKAFDKKSIMDKLMSPIFDPSLKADTSFNPLGANVQQIGSWF